MELSKPLIHKAPVFFMASPLISCVTFPKSLSPSGPQFSHP